MIKNSIIVPPDLSAGFFVNIQLGRFLYSHSLKSLLFIEGIFKSLLLHIFPIF